MCLKTKDYKFLEEAIAKREEIIADLLRKNEELRRVIFEQYALTTGLPQEYDKRPPGLTNRH